MRKARCTQAWRTQKQKDLIHYADQYLDPFPVENYEIKNMVILQNKAALLYSESVLKNMW